MDSFTLSLSIALGIALQMAIYFGIGFWRHWREYRRISIRGAELGDPAAEAEMARTESASPQAWSGWRTFRVARRVMEDGAQSVASFYLDPQDGKPLPPFLPGQYLTFRLEVPAPAGGVEAITRCYSLSDAPRADGYRISVKLAAAPAGSGHPPGRSSSYLHDHVEVGTLLEARAPGGHFHIDASHAPVVLIGGGIGITPMLSMLGWVLKTQPAREIWLFYGVRNGRELVMAPHLEALAAAHPNFHLHFCFSDPTDDDLAGPAHRHHGRVDVGLLRMQLPLNPYHFYICGPTPMMESLVPALEDWGVPPAHIHFEAFGPASIRRAATTAPFSTNESDAAPASELLVTFAKSGTQVPWSTTTGSLLDLAESNGIKVDSGCRAGGCGTCQTTIRSGEVAYRQPPDFDPEPGTCLLCMCSPKTHLTLEA